MPVWQRWGFTVANSDSGRVLWVSSRPSVTYFTEQPHLLSPGTCFCRDASPSASTAHNMCHLQYHARLLARPSHRLARPPVWNSATRSSFLAVAAGQTISQTRLKCSGSLGKSQHAETRAAASPPSMSSPSFWASKPVWRRAGVNTLRCLVGCTIGDFSSMWYLQAFYPDMGIEPIMAISSKLLLRRARAHAYVNRADLTSGLRRINLYAP